ncbi:membrane related protein CP5 [Hibiscus trionum]|uniref:Membrane related protein CP5 n=1 Tax=Hibiscus trionum TaxID=183268 RepID=A0A9W7IQX8_HIBTR|nr:membrane related protein CP5 [Hibiscus trionum]
MMYLVPFWIAFLVGILVGWAWKPKWAGQVTRKLSCALTKSLELSLPWSPCFNSLNMQSDACESWAIDNGDQGKPLSVSPSEYDNCSIRCSTSVANEGRSSVVTGEDLKHLWQLVEMRDGGPTWMHMMDRSTPNMSYHAWRRDPNTGPPQYRTETVFENATAKMVRDFFWDDEFRPKWDDMLAYSATIEECSTTGTMVVQWIRKFPFFCSDREYIIGRRIWEVDGSYYCVTKGVSCPSIPRRSKPRRVDMYYSSWCIRAVESRRGNGQLTACEVLLFHHEDMGIPWEFAKLGVRQGMWATVKKIEPGLRAYQKERESLASLSQSAYMAQINTKIRAEYLRSLGSNEHLSKSDVGDTSENPLSKNISRALIYGGLIVLACSLDHRVLSKVFIFGMGRRLANRGNGLS